MNFTNNLILLKISQGYKLTQMFYRLKFIERNKWIISGEFINVNEIKKYKKLIPEAKIFRVTKWKK